MTTTAPGLPRRPHAVLRPAQPLDELFDIVFVLPGAERPALPLNVVRLAQFAVRRPAGRRWHGPPTGPAA
ncbi:hypothetical protein ACIQF6_28280 [Kitasatospora sp. NPDC092948]|uniref:hypothetical protein n=1 Tax=Kitasatospora sp. NPDC092948 TaxID=3364088 RepID=UPI003814A5EF